MSVGDWLAAGTSVLFPAPDGRGNHPTASILVALDLLTGRHARGRPTSRLGIGNDRQPGSPGKWQWQSSNGEEVARHLVDGFGWILRCSPEAFPKSLLSAKMAVAGECRRVQSKLEMPRNAQRCRESGLGLTGRWGREALPVRSIPSRTTHSRHTTPTTHSCWTEKIGSG